MMNPYTSLLPARIKYAWHVYVNENYTLDMKDAEDFTTISTGEHSMYDILTYANDFIERNKKDGLADFHITYDSFTNNVFIQFTLKGVRNSEVLPAITFACVKYQSKRGRPRRFPREED